MIGSSGGLLLYWTDSIKVTLRSYSQGHIDCSVSLDDLVWQFTGFYGRPCISERHKSWDQLRRLYSINRGPSIPWVVGGDFNEIFYEYEKKGVI